MAQRLLISGAVLFIGLASTGTALAGQPTASDHPAVTFTKDIAPILQRSCQTCHRPDSVAPMSLLTYQQARPWASRPWQKGLFVSRGSSVRVGV